MAEPTRHGGTGPTSQATDPDVAFDDVLEAAERIRPYVHRTPVVTCATLDEMVGVRLFFKCEHLQKVGAFKARGATNAVQSLDPATAARGVAAHSSGNHAAALAWAARQRRIRTWIVMPSNASTAKRRAVEGYGAAVVTCGPTMDDREAALRLVLDQTGATEVHPYDNPRVIAGAGTAALELLEDVPDLDLVITPVGGGGLASGTALAVHGRRPDALVWGAEPDDADDAARSLATGTLQPAATTTTIADGLRGALSARTFAVLSAHLDRIVTVPDHESVAAMRLLWERAKQLVEPSAAVPLAALLRQRPQAPRVGVVLSGGNVDLDHLPWGG